MRLTGDGHVHSEWSWDTGGPKSDAAGRWPGSDRALELNIGGPIRPWIPQWWNEEGGRAITFASDAHTPEGLAGNFLEAMAMAEYFGFRPGRRPEDVWTR